MPPTSCFCSEIVPITSKVRVLIVRHAAEINKTSNTGRVVSRARAQ
jgi:DTW domain-containing protein YfiP